MSKKILFGKNGRDELKAGLDIVANAIKPTIGPKGRNIIIDKGFMSPQVTNDGVTGSNEIILKDSAKRLGAEIGKGVARKTNEEVGDGTTTSLVLTQSIFNSGLKYLEKGINVIALSDAIKDATGYIVERLKLDSKKIEEDIEIEQIATISAESAEIGRIIAKTIKDIGTSGVVSVEDSQTLGITSQIVEGMEIAKGFISPAMMTNFEKGISEQSDVPVLLTDKKIVMVDEILPLLESIVASGRKELFIVAEDITEGEALATILINKARGSFNITAIKAPGFGNGKKDLLEDIATVTGGRVIFTDTGESLNKVTINDLGIVKKVIVSKEKTVIIGDNKQKEKIDSRINSLKEQFKTVEGKIDKKTLEDRISKLAGGVATIKVGAVSETEQKYLKLKIEDAVSATKAAIEEGIVEGGGVALARLSRCKITKRWWWFGYYKKFDFDGISFKTKESELGYKIIMESILAPIQNILINAGKKKNEINKIISKIQKDDLYGFGYNIVTDKMIDNMIESGIIDPVKVTRTALQNASSASATLLTTDVVIHEEDKNN